VVESLWGTGRIPDLSALERASSKAKDRTTRGCSGVSRTVWGSHPPPTVLPREGATRGDKAHSTRGLDGEATAGFVNPDTGELCRRDHLWHLPVRPGVWWWAGRLRAATVPHEVLLKAPRGSRPTAPEVMTGWSEKGETPPV